jgi:hypothetical protein
MLLLAGCVGPLVSLHMDHAHIAYHVRESGAASFQTPCSDFVAHLTLTPHERHEIAAVALRDGFFDLPTYVSADSRPLQALDVVYPNICRTSLIELGLDGRRHTVHWDCMTAELLDHSDADVPRPLTTLVATIRHTFLVHAEVAAAAATRCRGLE